MRAGWRDANWTHGGTPGIAFGPPDQAIRQGLAAYRRRPRGVEKRHAADRAAACNRANGTSCERGSKPKTSTARATVTLLPHSEGKPLTWIDLGAASHVRTAKDWTRVELPIPELPKPIDRVYAFLSVKGSGTAWFDEFSLAEAGVDVPPGRSENRSPRPITRAFDSTMTACPSNLLKNPGFESGVSDWYVESGKPQIDEETAAQGRRSLRLDGFAECNYSIVASNVKIDPRRAYRLSLKLKTQFRAGLSCIQLLPVKANGEPIGFFTQDHTSEFCHGRGTQGWHEESIVLRQFPPETNTVHPLPEAAGCDRHGVVRRPSARASAAQGIAKGAKSHEAHRNGHLHAVARLG